MPFILIIINAVAILFAVIMLMTLPRQYKILFVLSGLAPIVITGLIAYFAYDTQTWGIKELAMILLRGGFIASVGCGGLACYITTKINNKEA